MLGRAGEKAIKDSTDEEWDFVMDVNLRGVFNCMRAELQRMDKNASIVSASSVVGLRGYGMGGPYSTSKVCDYPWVLESDHTEDFDSMALLA